MYNPINTEEARDIPPTTTPILLALVTKSVNSALRVKKYWLTAKNFMKKDIFGIHDLPRKLDFRCKINLAICKLHPEKVVASKHKNNGNNEKIEYEEKHFCVFGSLLGFRLEPF